MMLQLGVLELLGHERQDQAAEVAAASHAADQVIRPVFRQG